MIYSAIKDIAAIASSESPSCLLGWWVFFTGFMMDLPAIPLTPWICLIYSDVPFGGWWDLEGEVLDSTGLDVYEMGRMDGTQQHISLAMQLRSRHVCTDFHLFKTAQHRRHLKAKCMTQQPSCNWWWLWVCVLMLHAYYLLVRNLFLHMQLPGWRIKNRVRTAPLFSLASRNSSFDLHPDRTHLRLIFLLCWSPLTFTPSRSFQLPAEL